MANSTDGATNERRDRQLPSIYRWSVIGPYMVTEQFDGHACITVYDDGDEVPVRLVRTYEKALDVAARMNAKQA